ncbi:hypothetical protein CLG96_13905 [Sphingomonas oleivorans]|uniref:Septum formation initiator n=1 Tax=Sphingomonas oleivorans TaxID=1735121 RepID=A0A2T5FWS7_9SPHN|nr:septum formation initiator family protein [Sphingomonas oleivorans]PTQ10205.1 hypothetical protein CLG96_13905 [Sphingomonas oleivorans]
MRPGFGRGAHDIASSPEIPLHSWFFGDSLVLVNRRSTASLIRSALPPALALLVIAHFAGFALLGPNGLLSLGDYQKAIARRTVELRTIQAERDRLAHHAALLDPRRVDPDFADELVRRETGQVRPDEVIIPRN